MSDNAFLKPIEYYKRDINPISQYVDQMSFYLYRMLDKSRDKIKQSLTEKIKNKQIKLLDPLVHHFERNEFGDKYKKKQVYFSI